MISFRSMMFGLYVGSFASVLFVPLVLPLPTMLSVRVRLESLGSCQDFVRIEK
jgi:hypothetical protein